MRRRAQTAALAALVTLALLLFGGPTAARAQQAAGCEPDISLDTESGLGTLLTLIDQVRARGGGDAEVDRALAQRACLVRPLAGGGGGIPHVDGLTVAAPDLYTIAVVDGVDRWVAITDWSFTTLPAAPMTGNQAVATWFDVPVNPVLQVVHHSGLTSQYPNTSSEEAADVNEHGVGFLIAPQKSATDMNVATGRSALVFEGSGPCTELTARAAFAHTWNDTSIGSLGITSTGPAIGWTDTVDRAVNYSSPTRVSGVCG
ncbi:hypothetical protein [Streptomyces hoynatensis]|uniref:Secreted protein n=1 Tax=Streptomyces hoynatensis TaxID=1141874 RepID=A0A3A9YP30_9ACTN|nr:hypothetical protein [Streptomyces hoynatensis]RKN37762.1 hypothetical protein D7294_26785 [Streptomyces hoynatensis]